MRTITKGLKWAIRVIPLLRAPASASSLTDISGHAPEIVRCTYFCLNCATGCSTDRLNLYHLDQEAEPCAHEPGTACSSPSR